MIWLCSFLLSSRILLDCVRIYRTSCCLSIGFLKWRKSAGIFVFFGILETFRMMTYDQNAARTIPAAKKSSVGVKAIWSAKLDSFEKPPAEDPPPLPPPSCNTKLWNYFKNTSFSVANQDFNEKDGQKFTHFLKITCLNRVAGWKRNGKCNKNSLNCGVARLTAD